MAMKCPKRKEIIKNKRDEVKDNKSYSQAVKTNTNTAVTNTATPVDKEIHTKIFTCIMHAHVMNMAEPGTYAIELNKILKLNNLPCINAPQNPPSKKIFTTVTQIEEDNKQEEENIEENEAEEQVTENEDRIMKKTDQTKQILKGKNIGLMIYTPKSTGWPKETHKK